ncbi:deoxyribose-phosphate aldolase [Peribacillus sp. NPDC096447]|uniref:deoxyribose-phosphate aldolase n=1 Tax=Peribacillus sp. NPDC096447 TaxID=3364394 RepID=UPI0037F1D0BB
MSTAKMIDHTLLKAEATKEQIVTLCEEAREFGFASVCVNPVWVKTAAEKLKGSDVMVCTVIGPLGASTTAVKVIESENAIQNGAEEVDMVLAIGLLKSGEYEEVEADIRAVVDAVKTKALVKVIIETSLLTEEEKVLACELSIRAGADFVKTSTGFSTGGATVEDVALMRRIVKDKAGVKASGGIRDLKDLKSMVEAGATRVGASSGVRIMKGEAVLDGY